ncbi:MAG TPA: DUF3078 domain-containing protein [Bacteroidota bacterium]|jgi:hypothetical protein
MKKILIAFLALSSVSLGQDTAKVPVYGWTHNAVAGLTLSQVSYTDWSQGGDNALAWAATINAKSVDDLEEINWTNGYKFAFGQARLSDQGLRKTDDKIDLESILTYKTGSYINPYGAVTFKSQFATGYKYDAGVKTAVSAIFDPAYLTQSAGVGYQPIPQIKTRLGAGVREVLTSKYPAYADDPSTPEIETTKIDGGFESVTDIEWKLAENIALLSKLELFAPFNTLDEIVVRSDNTIVAKVNEYITVNLNVQLLQEPTITRRTQVKETLAIGLSYTLL